MRLSNVCVFVILWGHTSLQFCRNLAMLNTQAGCFVICSERIQCPPVQLICTIAKCITEHLCGTLSSAYSPQLYNSWNAKYIHNNVGLCFCEYRVSWNVTIMMCVCVSSASADIPPPAASSRLLPKSDTNVCTMNEYALCVCVCVCVYVCYFNHLDVSMIVFNERKWMGQRKRTNRISWWIVWSVCVCLCIINTSTINWGSCCSVHVCLHFPTVPTLIKL